MSMPLSLCSLDELSKCSIELLVGEGHAILRDQQRHIEAMVRSAFLIQLAGYRVLCAWAPILQSEVAGRLASAGAFGVAVRIDSGKLRFSLRSVPSFGVDVSEIARRFGGGGHEHAAGFEVPAASLPSAVRSMLL